MNATQHAPNTTLRGRWLLAARAGWVAVTTLTVAVLAAGFAVTLDRPDLTSQLLSRSILARTGLPDQATNVAFLMLIAASTGTALLIFWRRSDDWAAMLFALTLLTGAGAVTVRMESPLERAVPWLQLPVRFLWLLAMFLYLIVLFVFPDGRFVPRWTRLLAAAAVPAAVLLVDWPRLIGELSDGSQRASVARLGLMVLIWSVFWGVGLYAQAYRYRHVSGPVQRQQTKWVALALGLTLVLLLGIFIPALFVDIANAWFAWTTSALLPVSLLVPASVAVAILRHRLYDIDRLISRTLTYGLLTVVLGSGYAGAVMLLGQALTPRGGDSALAVAASTLLVAALFQPLRRRIQGRVDRRFNRRHYDAAKTIDAFSVRLREHLDLDTLSAELLGVVDQTMQPTRASLWLRPSARGSPDYRDAVAHRLALPPADASRSGHRGL